MKKSGTVAALLGMCVVLTVILLLFLPVFHITTYKVTGNELVSEDTIIAAARDNNENIFAYSKRRAVKALKKNNYIENARIIKHFPREIEIEITERKIRGYVEFTGSYLYLSDNGLVIDVQSEIKHPAPIITGLKFDTFTVGEVLNTDDPDAFDAMKDLSALFNRYQLMNDVLKVDITDPDDIRFYCGSVQVIYGENDGSTGKILTLIEILKKLDTSIPGTLDLTLENPTFTYTS